jgi:RNA polymerase sigma factor (sigma-70 family)
MSALVSTAQVAPKAGEVEDGELVRRIRRGDDHAFELIYQRYHRRITAYIHGMVHDHARAEDVAQDVFVSALRRMRETDRPIAFKPWVYEIAKNACIDQFRRSKRAEEISYDAEEGMGAADYGRLVSADAMPEAELESKTNLDHLRGAFGGLSETHHEILVMRELEGLSYREIGERLGMSRPSVESTLFRARRRLTEEYEELVSGARCQRIQGIIAGASGAEPGARDQRRLARHVSHCQPCRRQARLAGLEIPVAPDKPVRARIAAFLPLPLFLRRRWLGDSQSENSDVASAGSAHLSGVAQWGAQLGNVVDPGWFKAAATAATVVVAGAGAGVVGHTSTPTSPVGSFSQLVTGIATDSASPNGSLSAQSTVTRQRVAAALQAAQALAGASGAAGDGSAPARPGADQASADGKGGITDKNASAADAAQAGLPVDASGVTQVASGTTPPANSVPSGGGATSGGSTGSGSDVATPDTPNLPPPPDASAPTAPNAPAPPNVDTSASAPTPPPADATPPDTSGAAGTAGGAADDAGDAAGGATGGLSDATGGRSVTDVAADTAANAAAGVVTGG